MISKALGVAAATALLAVSIPAASGSPRQAHLAEAPDRRLATVTRIEVGGTPSSIVATRRAVWVATGLGGIIRLDPVSNAHIARLRPGGAVIDLARGFGALWAIDLFGDRLLRIDPRTNRVTDRVNVPAMPSGVATGHGLVWVTSQLDSTVVGVDPATGRIVKRVEFGYGELWPGGVATSRAGIWVIAGRGNELVLIEPAPLAIVRRVPILGARTLAVSSGAVWVGRSRSALLARVDAGGITFIPVERHRPDGYGPMLGSGSSLWLAARGRLGMLDARNRIAYSMRLPMVGEVGALAVAGDVWIANRSAGTVLRIRPPSAGARVLATAASPKG